MKFDRHLKADEGYEFINEYGMRMGTDYYTTQDADVSHIHQVKIVVEEEKNE